MGYPLLRGTGTPPDQKLLKDFLKRLSELPSWDSGGEQLTFWLSTSTGQERARYTEPCTLGPYLCECSVGAHRHCHMPWPQEV